MRDMDESMDTVEEPLGGISRRDMIKASVAAGALVWSAPVLLTGKAAAAGVPCCETGFVAVFVIPTGNTTINCGSAVSCLDNVGFPKTNANCPPNSNLIPCVGANFITIVPDGNRKATVELKPGVSLIAVAATQNNNCFVARCGCFASHQQDDTTVAGNQAGCPNICFLANDVDADPITPCTFGNNDTPLPPAAGEPFPLPPGHKVGMNRVWVLQNTKIDGSFGLNFTTVKFDVDAPGGSALTQVEFAVCLSSVVTAMC